MRVGVHRGCWHTWGPAGHPPWQGPALELGGSAHSHTHTHRAMEGTAVTGGFFCLNLFL